MDLYSTLSLWLTNVKSLPELDDFSRQLWKLSSEGKISDEDAIRLSEKVDVRRDNLKKAKSEGLAPPRDYYPKRKKSDRSRTEAAIGPRDPVRWARKRRFGDMASIRPEFRDRFTEGERAALYIIMSDWRQHRRCTRSVKEIGDRAGVGPTTVRNALRKASQLGLIRITERRQWRAKNLPNVIVVTHQRQIEWISKFRPNLGLKFYPIGFKKPASSGTFGNKTLDGRPISSRMAGPTGGLQPFASREPSSS